jgi:hypothetical protein
LVERKASAEEILREAYNRVGRSPTRDGLLLLRALAHEFGRREGGPVRFKELLASNFTDPLVHRE